MWVCKPDTEIPFLLKQRQMNHMLGKPILPRVPLH